MVDFITDIWWYCSIVYENRRLRKFLDWPINIRFGHLFIYNWGFQEHEQRKKNQRIRTKLTN